MQATGARTPGKTTLSNTPKTPRTGAQPGTTRPNQIQVRSNALTENRIATRKVKKTPNNEAASFKPIESVRVTPAKNTTTRTPTTKSVVGQQFITTKSTVAQQTTRTPTTKSALGQQTAKSTVAQQTTRTQTPKSTLGQQPSTTISTVTQQTTKTPTAKSPIGQQASTTKSTIAQQTTKTPTAKSPIVQQALTIKSTTTQQTQRTPSTRSSFGQAARTPRTQNNRIQSQISMFEKKDSQSQKEMGRFETLKKTKPGVEKVVQQKKTYVKESTQSPRQEQEQETSEVVTESLNLSSARKLFQTENQEVISIPKPTTSTTECLEEKKPKYVAVVKRDSSLHIPITPWGETEKDVTPVVVESVPPASPTTEQKEEVMVQEEGPKLQPEDTDVEIRQRLEPETETKNSHIEICRDSTLSSDSLDRFSGEESLIYKHPRAIDFARRGERKLWKDVEEVVSAGLLETMDKQQKVKQEAKFEFMMSEATYLNTLNLLKKNFMAHFKNHIPQVMTMRDYNILFGNIMDIRDCSEKFLSELDSKWQEDLMLDDIYEVITKYAANDFEVYKVYCRNMLEMSNHLEELTHKKEEFRTLMTMLTNRQTTQRLTLDSFLTTPMQRITKIPLLMRTILEKVVPDSEEHRRCTTAYEAACKIAQECDEVVNEKKRWEQLMLLNQQLKFPAEVRSIPIVRPGRYIDARDQVRHYAFRDGNTKKEKLTLILFNDLLLIAKRMDGLVLKSEQYSVVDHCPRDQVTVRKMDNGTLYNNSQDMSYQQMIVLTMESNSEHKKIELMVTFKDPSKCEPWVKYFAADGPHQEEDTIQVTATTEHVAETPEELSFLPGDVIQVESEEVDGWCQGELLSDGSRGKFLESKTTKIRSQKQRMANMKLKKEIRQSQRSDELII